MVLRLPRLVLRLLKGTRKSSRRSVMNHSLRARGDSLRDAGQFAKAAEAYSIYLQRTRDDFDIWVQNGNCLKEAGSLTQAKDAYDSALALRTNDADLYLQMGHLAKLMGNHTEARDAYGRSFELSRSQEAAIEIENINAYLLDKQSRQIVIDTVSLPAGLLPIPLNKDVSLPMEAPVFNDLVYELHNRVPIKMMTSLPADIRTFERDYKLTRQIREVSLLISKQSTISSGEG